MRHAPPAAKGGHQTGAGVEATQRRRGRRGGRRAAEAARRRAEAELATLTNAIENEYSERREGWKDADRPALSIGAAVDKAAVFDEKVADLFTEKTVAEHEVGR